MLTNLENKINEEMGKVDKEIGELKNSEQMRQTLEEEISKIKKE